MAAGLRGLRRRHGGVARLEGDMTHASPDGSAPVAHLKVDTHRAGGALVCRITGDLHLETLPTVKPALEAAAAERPSLLCLDLHDVHLCDAAGLGFLLHLSRRLPLAVINPGPALARILKLTGCEQHLRVFPTVQDAAAAMQRLDHRP
ncbi:STAS domain-containing protein [Kitasatospora sp. NPDC127111]|uniref:STAS domain-containing protein n=1 Tax=Kitasatospora sp. NPDC127111 TaxID=3345363 RepID=UPI00362F47A4